MVAASSLTGSSPKTSRIKREARSISLQSGPGGLGALARREKWIGFRDV